MRCRVSLLIAWLLILSACSVPAAPPVETLAPATMPTSPATPYNGPIIDAHGQVDQDVDLDEVSKLVDQAGVVSILLSARGTVTPEELVAFSANHPGKIIPAVRTKGELYENNDQKYYQFLKKQMAMEQYGAMAEVLMYHAQKGERAPLVVVYPDDKRVQTALDYALEKEWPFVVHIEFAAAGLQRDIFMTKLKALLIQYPEHPFVLIHMGQLNHVDVRQLIEAHKNIYFITSWANPVAIEGTNQPWTNMFHGDRLSTEWKQLITAYSERFILGFDNVFPEHWGQCYLDQVALWRGAIGELPPEVARSFAYGNAQRLWRLPPVH